MTVKERCCEWKKTVISKNTEIDLSLFREIVREAKEIKNRTFDFKISKKSLLDNVKTTAIKITAFNGFRAACNGSQACYLLETGIGISGKSESLTIFIRL